MDRHQYTWLSAEGAKEWGGKEWVAAAEAGSRVARLALVHGYGDQPVRLVAAVALELEAYADESHEHLNDFVMGGYVAPASEWLKLETPWREALDKAGLCEWHARDCEQNDGEFRGRTDRLELQETFVSLIRSVDLVGYAVRVDLNAYPSFFERVKASLPQERHRYFEPYPKAFEGLLQFMLRFATDKHPDAKRINFTFDEQDEFGGRAADLMAEQRANPDLEHRERLGGLTFSVSCDVVPLQVADTLAYEVHRQFRTGWPKPEAKIRWQSVKLSEGGAVSIANLDAEELARWAAMYPGKLG